MVITSNSSTNEATTTHSSTTLTVNRISYRQICMDENMFINLKSTNAQYANIIFVSYSCN